MDRPLLKKGDWIKIGTPSGLFVGADGYVLDLYPDGTIGIGYYQNKLKAIKTEAIWDGNNLQFKYPAPHGTYLRDREEAIVKNGPRNG